MNDTDFAYFAGYIDGDGCFHIAKFISKKTGNIKYFAKIIVSSTDQEILYSFKKFFGGIIRLSSNKIISHKPQYHFIVNGKNSIELVDKISPFLVEKKTESSLFKEFVTSTEKETKESIYSQLKHEKKFENLVKREQVDFLKSRKGIITPTNTDFAYLAGFIDAECSFGITRGIIKERENLIYKMYVHCNNSKFPVFKWLTERFQGATRFISRNIKDPKQRDQLSWRISAKTLSNILPKIHEFIRYKRSVCEELIKFDKTTLKNGGARHTKSFRESYAKVLIERDVIFKTVHILNRKGCLNV